MEWGLPINLRTFPLVLLDGIESVSFRFLILNFLSLAVKKNLREEQKGRISGNEKK